MTKAASIEEIKKQQKKLQIAYDKATAKMQEAKSVHAEKKTELVNFNYKYGRVITLMNED